MTRGVADLFQVVVFAAGAHAFLHGRCASVSARRTLLSKNHFLELDHSRVGEHQRRVVAGHYWRTRVDQVPLALEVVDEFFADFGGGHSGKYTRFSWLLCTWSARVSSSAASSLTRIEPRA